MTKLLRDLALTKKEFRALKPHMAPEYHALIKKIAFKGKDYGCDPTISKQVARYQLLKIYKLKYQKEYKPCI